jgi:hypothetical protein
VALLSLAVLLEGAYIVSRVFAGRASTPALGTVRLESNPSAARVTVDGKASGATPVEVSLAPGSHTVELTQGARRKTLAVTVTAGAKLAHYVELPAETPVTGQIDIRTDPAGARVVVDGVSRGVTPVVVAGLAVGDHQVRLEEGSRSVTQSVKVEGAQAASLFVPFARGEAPAAGWLSIDAPLEVQLYEGEALLGTSRTDRIMLPAGRHVLTLASDAIGFREARTVQVPAGRTAAVNVTFPKGSMDINATPWAEVFVDGEKVGETPLAGVPVSAGRHSVRFRHPTLGERTLECLVTLK